MVFHWRDDRRVHVLTRGNVDGITSAALFLAQDPHAKVTFVTSASSSVEVLRKDITSDAFYLIDLGLTPRLVKNLNDKAKAGALVTLIDHHQQTALMAPLLASGCEVVVEQGASAASVARRFLAHEGLSHLAAISDLVEYCPGPCLRDALAEHGAARLEKEARILDFAWRLQVDDNRFRLNAARRLATGAWPSEVPEIARRWLQVVNEGRWERALQKVRHRLEVDGPVGLLRFGKRKPSLFGFGSRALTAVAREKGLTVALLINTRSRVCAISARVLEYPAWAYPAPAAAEVAPLGPPLGRPEMNLGRFIDEFTRENGIVGGGHPHSAGAKIHSRHVGEFIRQVRCFA